MARVNRVDTSAKEYTCSYGGGHVIPKGSPYLWAKPGFRTRTKKIRCVDHPFRPSDLATGQNQGMLVAKETFEDTLGTLEMYDYDGLNAAVQELQSAAQDYVNLRREALDAWENGNSTLEEFVSQAEDAQSYADGLYEFEDLDESEREDDEDDEAWEYRREEHWNEAVSEAEDAVGSMDV